VKKVRIYFTPLCIILH